MERDSAQLSLHELVIAALARGTVAQQQSVAALETYLRLRGEVAATLEASHARRARQEPPPHP